MSMNICIEASREIQVVSTGKICTQTTSFDCWQTPTRITHDILDSDKPLDTYIAWVMSNCHDEQYPQYAEDDIFNDGPIVGYETHNPGREHVSQLQMWIDHSEQEGYTIHWSMI